MSEPVLLGMPALPTSPRGVGNLRGDETFPVAARRALANGQLRANLGHATQTIRTKRAQVVGEVAGWEALREAGSQLKRHTMGDLETYLLQLEEKVSGRQVVSCYDTRTGELLYRRTLGLGDDQQEPLEDW